VSEREPRAGNGWKHIVNLAGVAVVDAQDD
jgi:hypothetical protein